MITSLYLKFHIFIVDFFITFDFQNILLKHEILIAEFFWCPFKFSTWGKCLIYLIYLSLNLALTAGQLSDDSILCRWAESTSSKGFWVVHFCFYQPKVTFLMVDSFSSWITKLVWHETEPLTNWQSEKEIFIVLRPLNFGNRLLPRPSWPVHKLLFKVGCLIAT